MVYQLKYHNHRAIASVIGGLLGNFLRDNTIPADAVIPVPLHPRRERQRGYNQSSLLAWEIGRRQGIPVIDKVVARVKDSPPQASSAGVEERSRNVQDAFVVIDRGIIEGRKVVVIDDVCTTGSTLDACASALKASGAESVWGLTIAREA